MRVEYFQPDSRGVLVGRFYSLINGQFKYFTPCGSFRVVGLRDYSTFIRLRVDERGYFYYGVITRKEIE